MTHGHDQERSLKHTYRVLAQAACHLNSICWNSIAVEGQPGVEYQSLAMDSTDANLPILAESQNQSVP